MSVVITRETRAVAAKKTKNYRLSAETLAYLEGLSKFYGLTQTAVVELAVRRLYRSERLPEPPGAAAPKKSGKKRSGPA